MATVSNAPPFGGLNSNDVSNTVTLADSNSHYEIMIYCTGSTCVVNINDISDAVLVPQNILYSVKVPRLAKIATSAASGTWINWVRQ